MKKSLAFLVCMLLVCAVCAESPSTFQGRGEWGRESLGLCCRVTVDRDTYEIGDSVRVLVEVRNTTDQPVSIGMEPLIEIKGDGNSILSRQPAELHMTFSQGNPGFFATYHITFPRGRKSEARAVVIQPRATFSEIVEVAPWGPTFSSSPATAQPGQMSLKAALWQFLTPDLKKAELKAKVVEMRVKGTSRGFEPDGAANGSQPIRSEANRTSSTAGSRR